MGEPEDRLMKGGEGKDELSDASASGRVPGMTLVHRPKKGPIERHL